MRFLRARATLPVVFVPPSPSIVAFVLSLFMVLWPLLLVLVLVLVLLVVGASVSPLRRCVFVLHILFILCPMLFFV